jgi:hypothetical protein
MAANTIEREVEKGLSKLCVFVFITDFSVDY